MRAILLSVSRWCTVTVTDPDGRRHSLDLLADSTYDAAHLFVVEAKMERAVGLPKPTLATVFEVIANGKVYRVAGMALQRWIVQRRQSLNGPDVQQAPGPGIAVNSCTADRDITAPPQIRRRDEAVPPFLTSSDHRLFLRHFLSGYRSYGAKHASTSVQSLPRPPVGLLRSYTVRCPITSLTMKSRAVARFSGFVDMNPMGMEIGPSRW